MNKININFENIDERFLYWYAGFMAADGCISKSRISLSQSKKCGEEIMEFVKYKLQYSGNILNHITASGNTSYGISYISAEMLNFLSSLNIAPVKTYNYLMPKLNEARFKWFMQGYIEGDGSILISKNAKEYEHLRVSFVGTKEFCESFISKKDMPVGGIRHIKRCKNLSEVYYSGRNAKKIIEFLFEDIVYINGKYQTYKKYIDFVENKKNYFRVELDRETIISEFKKGLNGYQISKKHNTAMGWTYAVIKKYIEEISSSQISIV